MVCFFCIAVFALIAGAVAAADVDRIEDQLATKAADGVRRVSDTESAARFELTVEIDGRKAPVAVTVYKEHARVRIQVLTHQLTPEQITRLEDQLAEALEAKVVDRSQPDPHEHEDEHGEDEQEEGERERAESAASPPQKEKEREPERPR